MISIIVNLLSHVIKKMIQGGAIGSQELLFLWTRNLLYASGYAIPWKRLLYKGRIL